MKLTTFAASAFLAFATAASGAVITENGNGDFDFGNGNSTNLGVLSLGSNTISGSIFAECITARTGCLQFGGDPDDGFLIDIGAGREVSAAVFTVSNTDIGGMAEFVSVKISLVDIMVPSTISITGDGSRNAVNFLGETGLQRVQIRPNIGIVGAIGDTVSFDWSFEISTIESVSTVPLPAGLPMLVGGVMLLGGLKKRSRTSV